MVGRPGTRRVTPSGSGRSARGGAYGGEAPRGAVDPGLVIRADRELDRVGPDAGEREDAVREHVGELVQAVLAQVEHRVAPLVVARVRLDAGLAAVAVHARAT